MRTRILCGIVLLLGAGPLAAQGASTPDAAALGWMTGCWEQRRGETVTREHWMAPAGGSLLGMSRSLRGDALRDWEFMFIGPDAERLAFVARPSGQVGATFPALLANDTIAVFEQVAHDFPQRVVYRRGDADSLFAFIEGPVNGRTLRVDFAFRRVACP